VPRLRIEQVNTLQLNGVSLSVNAGECVCISGSSGSGKTLLLRAIADLDPHQGEVYLDDIPSQQIPAPQWRRQVALLSAESQWWAETVGEHFESVDESFLRSLGFTSSPMDWSIERLSTGEKQRLALLRVLGLKPKVLLLDEPTANLDFASGQAMEHLLMEYQRSEQVAVIWVSHDAAQIARVAQRHFEIESDRIQEHARCN